MAYTFVVHTPDVFGDPIFATRHEAVGEKCILESLHPGWELSIGVRERYATDPI